MASLTTPVLEIEVVNDGANLVANVTVTYTINWSIQDQAGETQYREVCKLIGDDTGIVPAEDGTDDAIPNGQLFPQLVFPPFPVPLPAAALVPIPSGVISSGGDASTDRVHKKTISLTNLDEDKNPVPNPDELRAVASLTPIAPQAVSRESNQVLLNVG
jgi:hypothetical protein